MNNPSGDPQNDQRPTFTTGVCPLCEGKIALSQYPRHRILLEDGTDTIPNQVVENRLCEVCWETLAATIS